MNKLLKFLLICIPGVLLLSCNNPETTQAAPATKSPNVEFTYGFKFVKLRVYSCKPCSEAQANSAAGLLAESGKVTAHAFFDMDDAAFKDLEGKITSAGSFVKAEQIINAANPKQFRRVMANGKMMNQ